MKLNIKGLVFVGFAAAVFASAAHAEDKVVTSKTYVDSKYVGSGAVSVDDGAAGTADANKKVITVASYQGATAQNAGVPGLVPSATTAQRDYVLKGDGNWAEIDGTAYTEGAGININNHAISTDLVGAGNTTVTVGDGTNGITDGTVQIKSPTFKQAGAVVSPDANGVVEFTDTTYNVFTTSTNGLVPAADGTGEDGMFLKGDGTWATPVNTTYDDFTAATAGTAGAHGLVPAPAAGDDDAVLLGNKTWGALATGDNDGQIKIGNNNVSVKNAEVTTHKITTIDSTTASITGNGTGDTTYPTTHAVYDFVTTLGNVLPANTNNACGTTSPCALVFDGTNVTWELIQQ